MDAAELRDHAREILLAVADDMASEQSNQQQIDKSRGLRPDCSPDLRSAASLHGLGRLAESFSLNDLAVELRALRASVLRHIDIMAVDVSIKEVTRFNEAIDQVMGDSIVAYASKLEHTQSLEREAKYRRHLMLRMEASQDEDRRRIARDLHDSLGQKLVAMSLCLSALRHQPVDDSARRPLDQLTHLLAESDSELDRIVFELRPVALEDCGLVDALNQHVTAWAEMAGVQLDMAESLGATKLPQHVEGAIFRVIQEALNNVAKHADARRVSVALHRQQDWIAVSVEDDGVGFQVADADSILRPPGWGVAGMRERVEALGGQFTLESSEGGGTTVLIRLPLKPLERLPRDGF